MGDQAAAGLTAVELRRRVRAAARNTPSHFVPSPADLEQWLLEQKLAARTLDGRLLATRRAVDLGSGLA